MRNIWRYIYANSTNQTLRQQQKLISCRYAEMTFRLEIMKYVLPDI